MITPTARVTAARLAIREARPRRRTSILLWAGQIPLAAFFMFVAAVPHLAGSHQAVQEFGLIGAGITVTSDQSDVLHVRGLTAEQIGAAAWQAHLPVFELATRHASLELSLIHISEPTRPY